VTLVLPAEAPTQEEIDAILMAADAIINQAGRSGLTLILNGSRSKKALEWEWDKLPDYGALRHLTADQITRKIDWCIHHKWLRLEHNRNGIPLLCHPGQWEEQAKELWLERLLGWFEDWQETGQPEEVWSWLKTTNRDIKFMLLEAIGEQGRRDLSPVLRAWFPHEVKAVRKAINHTLQGLGQRTLPHPDRRSTQGMK